MRTVKTAWITGLALTIGAAAQAKIIAPPDVIVLVENDTATLRWSILWQAEQMAGVMFADIGVRIVWQEPRAKEQAAVVILQLKITDRPSSEFKHDLAYALAYPYADAAKPITIRWDRVDERCRYAPVLAFALLAHVMVHEITHVLEGTDSHSATGVMKAQFVSSDYRDMIYKPLPFTSYEVTQVQLGLDRLRQRARTGARSR
jgi:hypothetical protein